jgi:hypothetical protein
MAVSGVSSNDKSYSFQSKVAKSLGYRDESKIPKKYDDFKERNYSILAKDILLFDESKSKAILETFPGLNVVAAIVRIAGGCIRLFISPFVCACNKNMAFLKNTARFMARAPIDLTFLYYKVHKNIKKEYDKQQVEVSKDLKKYNIEQGQASLNNVSKKTDGLNK